MELGNTYLQTLSLILAKCPSIEILDLEGNSITDEGADILGELFKNINSKIRKINLSFNSVTNDGAWRLAARAFEKNRAANNKAYNQTVTKIQKINLYNNRGIELGKLNEEVW